MEKKIEFTNTFSNDYRIITATGAFGGVSPNGEIVFDLYVDKPIAPKNEEFVVNDKHELKKVGVISESVDKFERQRQIGIVLRADVAKMVAVWILNKVKQMEEQVREIEEIKKREKSNG